MAIRFAILGAGRIGQVHARAVAAVPGATLAAIYDPMNEAAKSVADTYGAEIRSVEDCAAAQDIDAVLICTPTDLHADQIELFARAGKAVFCEKPVDLSVPRVQACLKTVEDTGTPLMIGFNRRFDHDFRALRAAIDAGKIGDVEMVTITSRDPGAPPVDYIKRSGGIFRDMTIHDFDVARWMLGEEVEYVHAEGAVMTDPAIGEAGDFDQVNVLLKTASGRQAVITNSRRAAYGYDQRIEVLGALGMVSAANSHEARIEVAGADGYTKPPLLNFFMDRYAAAYATEIAAFIEAISQGTTPPTTGHDGLMALVLAEAATISAKEGHRVAVADILG
ncbi:MAG: inositol 2-dehydrogenase [Silicimonas sp.]|nr:inositol 2-dehydrogenase [Silicimonas sp.]